MKIVGCDRRNLDNAAHIVNNGGLIVFPTDTVYGLGCDPFNVEALRRIYSVKERNGKPFPTLCSNLRMVDELVHLGSTGTRLAKTFWPGPLTIVAPLKNTTRPLPLTSGEGSLGVRIPNHEITLLLIELCGGMLVGTSANRSNLPPPKSPDEVFRVLPSGFDLLIDGGRTPLGLESTVVLLPRNGYRVLREGAISRAEVEQALAE